MGPAMAVPLPAGRATGRNEALREAPQDPGADSRGCGARRRALRRQAL